MDTIKGFQVVSKWIAENTKFLDLYDGEELSLPLVTHEQIRQEQARVVCSPHLMPDLEIGYTAHWQRDNLTIYVGL